ncbi:MAG: HYC_CC_PP family protein [Bacteroidota bacterium]
MKRLPLYILVVFYFLISIRITANVHYCKGKFKSISIVGFTKQKKCCKGTTMAGNCCKDSKFSLKKGDSSEKSLSSTVVPKIYFEYAQPLAILTPVYTAEFQKNDEPVRINPPPPPAAFPSIYIKNCVFII